MPQGTYKHTTDDIQDHTGLPRHFIHRCSSKISDILDPYRQHGDNNKLLYDDSGLIVFDQIAQLKREGKNIPEIRAVLEDHLQDLKDDSKSDRKTSQNDLQNAQNETSEKSSQTTDSEPWMTALKEAYQEVATAKDEVIESKDETINSLQQNLRLLTDGRDPEKVKEEHQQKIEEAAETKQELEQLREEKKRQKETERRRQQKREKLLAELKSLEGKWFSGDRRREIIAELERLDREEEEAINLEDA